MLRKRLSDLEADLLGLDLKKKTDYGNPKYQINQEQWDLIQETRFSGIPEDKSFVTKKEPSKKEVAFELSAWTEDGRIMNIDEFAKHHNLNRGDMTSWRLCTHTKVPTYNISFNENKVEETIDIDNVKSILEKEIQSTYKYKQKEFIQDKETALKWADLHFGAHIRNLIRTKDYDSSILRDKMFKSVNKVNSQSFKKVHIHIMGDLIESFSGLNHVNSWMSMDKDEIGAMAVKLCTKLISDAASQINNLGSIKIVAGNHDRVSKNKDEDVKGGAAELIAWGLELIGYDVEFHPFVITHQVDGINHINLHGDKGLSKKTTEEILWKYGKQGMFNFIFEAHLHSIIEKLSLTQRKNFKTIKDDSVDHRRMHCPSFFTGNYYSETLGYDSNSGYLIVSDSGEGTPDVFMMSA